MSSVQRGRSIGDERAEIDKFVKEHIDVFRVKESTLKNAFRDSIGNQDADNELFNSLRMDFPAF